MPSDSVPSWTVVVGATFDQTLSHTAGQRVFFMLFDCLANILFSSPAPENSPAELVLFISLFTLFFPVMPPVQLLERQLILVKGRPVLVRFMCALIPGNCN